MYDKQIIYMCTKNCECHNGTPFDQCECICPAWCYNPDFNYVLEEEPESCILVCGDRND